MKVRKANKSIPHAKAPRIVIGHLSIAIGQSSGVPIWSTSIFARSAIQCAAAQQPDTRVAGAVARTSCALRALPNSPRSRRQPVAQAVRPGTPVAPGLRALRALYTAVLCPLVSVL